MTDARSTDRPIAHATHATDHSGVYRSILVPLDGSELAERALTVAASLAARLHSALCIVHVFRDRVIDELPTYGLAGETAHATAQAYVLAAADRIRAAHGGVVTGHVLEGSAAGAIAAAVTSEGIDLIVMSSHGRTGASRFWLGSVTDAVIRSATVPVLMVRGGKSGGASTELFEHVLVPLDGSSLAETVIPHAIALARLNDANIHLLQVEERAEDLRTSVWGLAAHAPDDLPARLEHADRYLHTLIATFQPDWPPATVSAEARGGHRIGEAIAQVAIERGSDLIAMTTHGRGASRVLIGSVADKVIRGTSCSVLLCRGR